MDETDDIKLIKTISLETITKSHNSNSFINSSTDYEGGLRSYRQARKDRKKAPLNSARGLKSTLEALDKQTKNKTPSRVNKKEALGGNYNYERKRVNSKSKCLGVRGGADEYRFCGWEYCDDGCAQGAQFYKGAEAI